MTQVASDYTLQSDVATGTLLSVQPQLDGVRDTFSRLQQQHLIEKRQATKQRRRYKFKEYPLAAGKEGAFHDELHQDRQKCSRSGK